MSVRYVSVDRVPKLKALQRPPRPPSDDGGSQFPAKATFKDPEQLARTLGATPKTNQFGEYLSVRCWCANPPRYLPDSGAVRLLSAEGPENIADPEQWLFLDTETTGLAGGSGTYAFLIGVAWWENGGLEIEQFFLREYCEERSLLLALRERIAERPVLVTFNGKSFDWPLLETRFRMSRKIAVPELGRILISFIPPGICGGSALDRCACPNSNVTFWAGTAVRTSSLVSYRKSIPIMCEEALPNAWFRFSITTRWTCVGWRRFPPEFFRCSATLKTRGKTDSKSLVCPVFVRNEESMLAPESSTRSRLLPLCQQRQIGWHDDPWRNWRSVLAISI